MFLNEVSRKIEPHKLNKTAFDVDFYLAILFIRDHILSVNSILGMFVVRSPKNKCADAIPRPCRACGALPEKSHHC